jgi:adenosylcobinamide-GDP ribazoletransferase
MTRPASLPAPTRAARPATGRVAAAAAELRAAVSFLTRVPVHRRTAELDRTGAAAFGLVGAGIGIVAAVPVLLLGARLPLPAAVGCLIVMALVSGGLHLDGLADTADALAAPAPDAAERARTDPRAGAAGVTAIVLVLLLDIALLAAIAAADPRLAAVAVVVAATGSRSSAPIAAWIEGRRRAPPPVGLGGWFASRVRGVDAAVAVDTMIAVVLIGATIAGFAVALGTVVGIGLATAGAAFVVNGRGKLDGDGYGAIVEITFVAILAAIAVQLPIPAS